MQIDRIFEKTKNHEYLEFFKNEEKFKCSHLFLAIQINESQDMNQIFEQSTIKNIIDIQFIYTKEEIKKYLVIYILGFFIPYVYNSLALISIENLQDETKEHFTLRWILYLLQAAIQIYFLRLEIPEIYYQKFDYFKEIYNVFDISQPILFTIHLILRIIYGRL